MHDDALRKSLNSMNEQLAALKATPSAEAARGVAAAWDAVVGQLRLEPFPPTRACPHCGREGMLAATRCGSCWRELVPPVGG